MNDLIGKTILDKRISETEIGTCGFVVFRESEKSVWAKRLGGVYRMTRSHVERHYRVVG